MGILNDLSEECYRISKDHGFHDPPKSVAEDIALMHSELSEALEDHRSGYKPDFMWYETKSSSNDAEGPLKPCGIPSEIADLIIRALDFCGAHNINIDKAVSEKMAFNRSRPYKHGKVL